MPSEQIDQGAGGSCEGSRGVTLTPRGEGLNYLFGGGGVSSTGVLQRTDTAGLGPVFEQAGVTPPG
jgi:hypothetical protein